MVRHAEPSWRQPGQIRAGRFIQAKHCVVDILQVGQVDFNFFSASAIVAPESIAFDAKTGILTTCSVRQCFDLGFGDTFQYQFNY